MNKVVSASADKTVILYKLKMAIILYWNNVNTHLIPKVQQSIYLYVLNDVRDEWENNKSILINVFHKGQP
jgi:hypothetical protein